MTEIAPEIRARIEASFGAQTMMQTFGAEIEAIAPGAVRLTAPIGPHLLQQHGYAHAGLAFALGDSAAGYSALTLMRPEQEVLTAEMKINLLAPAEGDRLIAEGRVLKPGRRLMVVTADVHAERDGTRRHIAVLQGTMIPTG